ncbi:MAG: PQQ-binding-like beta-propeller repeat protein [Planctomycetota bacterium]|nr:PQQ-binding-like beta-propeller repeat protein [Planctomycetota bacterium]
MLSRWFSFLFVLLCIATPVAHPADWPQWGRDNSRNMASDETNIPASFDPGKKLNPNEFDLATSKNIKWIARLGTQTYGNPVVSNGRVFVGTNDDLPERPARGKKCGGAVLCFDEATGKRLWTLHIPRNLTNNPLFNFDDLSLGVCSSPLVENDRLYLVSNRCEVLCLDTNGQANGNDGPFTDEAKFQTNPGDPSIPVTPVTGDVVWRFDMLTQPGVQCWPQDAADCSIIVRGPYLYVCTSNGVDRSHKRIPRPNAPSIIVLDKKTGQLIATDDAHIGPNILHGEWSSPALATLNGQDQLIFGAGDGRCYAFDPNPSPGPDGKQILKTLWKFDVNPPERRILNGQPVKYPTKFSASEVIATPVVYKNRVYIDVGQDPRHGKGPGMLACIDPTKTGDITTTGKIWLYDKIARSLSTVSIHNNLLFVADFHGIVHCLNPDTGQPYWTHDTGSPLWSSTLAADNKVFLGTETGELWIFAASKKKELLNKIALDNKIYTTPITANGVLYVTTQSHLYAIQSR